LIIRAYPLVDEIHTLYIAYLFLSSVPHCRI